MLLQRLIGKGIALKVPYPPPQVPHPLVTTFVPIRFIRFIHFGPLTVITNSEVNGLSEATTLSLPLPLALPVSSADEADRSNFLNIIAEKSVTYASHRDHIFVDTYFFNTNPITQVDAYRSLTVENAGGKSEVSEALSIQYFHDKFIATNILLEKEVDYRFYNCKMVDFVCTINEVRLGVSVTRAMGYPNPERFDREAADHLLQKKLYGLIVARNAVNKQHRFFKSILHVFCQTEHIAELLVEAYASLDVNDFGLDIRGAVILQLTICPDTRIYENKL